MITERRLIMETTFISKENGQGRWSHPTHTSQGHHRQKYHNIIQGGIIMGLTFLSKNELAVKGNSYVGYLFQIIG